MQATKARARLCGGPGLPLLLGTTKVPKYHVLAHIILNTLHALGLNWICKVTGLKDILVYHMALPLFSG